MGGTTARGEFERMRQFSHPNVVRVVELYENPLCVQLVCEYCEGGDLYNAFKTILLCGSLDQRWIASVVKQVFEAVNYLQKSHQMVHNDLKPDNILLERLPTSSMDVPRVMVGDFGQAAVFGMPQPGDPRYCSPEAHRMALGQGGVPGFKGDVYMLGVTLYELLSGGNLPYIEQPCTLSQYSDPKNAHVQKRIVIEGCLGQLEPRFESLTAGGVRAKDLTTRMMSKTSDTRVSIGECLNHQWMDIIKESAPRVVDPALLGGLVRRAKKSRLHRVFLNLMATQLQGEALASYREIWVTIDTDNSGTIDRSEFVQYMVSNGIDAVEASDMFFAADVKCTGLMA